MSCDKKLGNKLLGFVFDTSNHLWSPLDGWCIYFFINLFLSKHSWRFQGDHCKYTNSKTFPVFWQFFQDFLVSSIFCRKTVLKQITFEWYKIRDKTLYVKILNGKIDFSNIHFGKLRLRYFRKWSVLCYEVNHWHKSVE